MAYYPQNFNFKKDKATGLKVYDDDQVQVTYLNLRIVSELVYNLQDRAREDLLDAQNNISVKAVHDQTPQVLGMFASKIFEGISVFFKAGTAPAIASMLIGRIISGIITQAIKESSPNDDIQKKANEIRDGIDAIFEELKYRIDKMVGDLENQWDVIHHCEGYLDPSLKGDVRLSDFADGLEPFPDKDSTEYDEFSVFLQARCRKIIISQLLPAKWYRGNWPTYYCRDYYQTGGRGDKKYDFDDTRYNPHTDEDFWYQQFDSLPGVGLGSAYFVEPLPDSGYVDFQKFLVNVCTGSSDNHSKYSSYFNYAVERDEIRGDRHYHGADITNYIMVDSNGDWAPTVLTDWLFIDDASGNIINKRGIATRKEVYQDWNLIRR